MSQKKVREYDAKRILSRWLHDYSENEHSASGHIVRVSSEDVARTSFCVSFTFNSDVSNINITHTENMSSWKKKIVSEHPWIVKSKLVVKVDQLIKRRGKNGLIKVNASFEEATEWISNMMNVSKTVEGTTGVLNNFLIEQLVPHKQSEEYYLCIHTDRQGDEILFHHEGGVDVGDVDAKATRVRYSEDEVPSTKQISDSLLSKLKDEKRRKMVASYVRSLLLLYRDLHFCYFEINPLVCLSDRVVALDVASVLDETAEYLCMSSLSLQ